MNIPFQVLRNSKSEKNLHRIRYPKSKTFKITFFSLLQNDGILQRSHIDMLAFLENIKYKKKFTLQSDTNIVYRYVVHVLVFNSIILTGQP